MSNDMKNLIDVLLSIITMAGAAIAFFHTIQTWKTGQMWERAKKLDEFIKDFESNELLKLQCYILDYTNRNVLYMGQVFAIRNNDVLIALKVVDQTSLTNFNKEQVIIRDSFDSFITFLSRLSVAVDSNLVDKNNAQNYFKYWFENFLCLRYHEDRDKVLVSGQTPQAAAQLFLEMYSNYEIVKNLAVHFKLEQYFVHARSNVDVN